MFRNGKTTYSGEFLQRFRDHWLLDTQPTPFAHILHLRAYGRRVRNCDTQVGNISWAPDFQSLTCQDVYIDLARFRGFLTVELEMLEQELRQLCLLDPSRPGTGCLSGLDLDRLTDHPGQLRAGYSFFSEPGNGLQGYEREVLGRALRDADLQARFFGGRSRRGQAGEAGDGSTETRWQESTVKRYLRLHRQFLTRLAMLCLILGGQPPRTPELFSVRVRNTANGERHLFLDHGMVMLATRYHKGYSVEGSCKLIHRFLPRRLGEALVRYLVLVQPFVQQLHQLTWQKHWDTTYLWDPQRWQAAQVSGFWAQESVRILGERSRVQVGVWRHLAVAIARELMPRGEGWHQEAGQVQSDDLDRQAGHHPYQAASTYARLTTQARGELRPQKDRYRRLSERWHELWEVGSLENTERRVPNNTPKRAIEEEEEEKQAGAVRGPRRRLGGPDRASTRPANSLHPVMAQDFTEAVDRGDGEETWDGGGPGGEDDRSQGSAIDAAALQPALVRSSARESSVDRAAVAAVHKDGCEEFSAFEAFQEQWQRFQRYQIYQNRGREPSG